MKRSSTPTIKDIAARAGVSISTVHYALRRTRPISDETRRRVLAAIEALDYQPHAGAATLPSGKTGRLAVVISGIDPAFANPYFSDVIRGLAAAAEAHDHTVVLYTAYEGRVAEGWRPAHILRRREADGLVLVGTQIHRDHLDELVDLGGPCVLLNREHPGLPSIVPDRAQGAALATRHLLQVGRRPVGLLVAAYPGSLPEGERPELAGYLAAHRDLDVPAAAAYIDFAPVAAGRHEAGAPLVRRLRDARLAAGDGPAPGLLIFSYTLAPAVCHTIAQSAARVPQDLAVVVADEDVDASDSLDVPLTIVRSPKFVMAQAAVSVLMELHRGRPLADERRCQRLPMTLQVRWSCGARRRPGGASRAPPGVEPATAGSDWSIGCID
ncbi:MAG: LacI family DNA-binding transcriptional regulator [Chloroflexota bacterium]